MVFYERASGARMHANYFRFGGVHEDKQRNVDIGAIKRFAMSCCCQTEKKPAAETTPEVAAAAGAQNSETPKAASDECSGSKKERSKRGGC